MAAASALRRAGVHMEPPQAFQQLHISPCILMYTHTCPTGYCGLSWRPCLSHFFPHHRSGQLKGICPGLLLSLSKLTFKQVPRVNSLTKTVLWWYLAKVSLTATDVTSIAPSANQFSPNQQQTQVKRSGQTCNTNNFHNHMPHTIGNTLAVTQ